MSEHQIVQMNPVVHGGALYEAHERDLEFGTIYGVGVGPGDPELITLKGLRLLQSAPTIFAPVARRGSWSLARHIVERHIDPVRQRLVELIFDMRDEAEGKETSWRRNARAIRAALAGGQDAVFVTEGDPLLYSTFVHIARALGQEAPDTKIVVVPGISSIHAAAAAAGVPLADGDERLAILPACSATSDLRALLESFDTIVLVKVASELDSVLDLLDETGTADDSVLVTRCGWPDELVVTDVRQLRGRTLSYFSTLIIRKRP